MDALEKLIGGLVNRFRWAATLGGGSKVPEIAAQQKGWAQSADELESLLPALRESVNAEIATIRQRQHEATLRAAAWASKTTVPNSNADYQIGFLHGQQAAQNAILALPMPPLDADDEKEEVAGEL
jgi:hypothetical protein